MRAGLVELFADRYGAPPARSEPVSADGSARRYWRLWSPAGEAVIGAYGPEAEENRAFLSFSRTFRKLGLPVPDIYAADETAGVWLEEDLGDHTLFDLLTAARQETSAGQEEGDFPTSVVPLYRRVVELLPRFQVEGADAVDFQVAYPREAFDRQSILWDLNYFKYHFLKLAHLPFSEARLERDFGRLARFLLKAPRDFFLYRDFQSRNVMIRAGEPWFIDYQGGRRGALHYDPASLLYDAKADLPPSLRASLLEAYLDALETHVAVDREAFRKRYPGFVLVRLLQAMGAYGYRGFFERKPHFFQSVPYAARTLARLVDEGLPLRVPELERVLRRIADIWAERDPDAWEEWRELSWGEKPSAPRAERSAPAAPASIRAASVDEGRGRAVSDEWESVLTIRVVSFSFRRGYPRDEPGHGGPVFDCRVLPNPGRLEAYRSSTGLDQETIAFLEACEETEKFWELVRPLVEAQVREFLDRGHTHLTIQFGCTGGQHRSPYCAERLGRYLREAFPASRVEVIHRERSTWPGEASAWKR